MTHSELIRLVVVAVCSGAAGAGGGWYLTKATLSPPVHTVSWFQEHQSEMMRKVAACNDNPGGAMTDPECTNAENAKEHIDLSKLLEMPPK